MRQRLAQTGKGLAPLLALAVLLAGCAGSGLLAPPPDPETVLPALEQRVFVRIEEERQKLNPAARPLMLDPQLSDIARARSLDMAQKNYLGRPAPEGDTAASILMERDGQFQGLLGENVAAQHYTSAGGVDATGFADRFVATWLESESHKENLSFADYNRTGIGAAVNGDTVFVTQLFATDLGMGPYKGGSADQSVTEMPDARTGKADLMREKAKARGSLPAQPPAP